MQTRPLHPPRWPKGPFPVKYLFEAVETRLRAARAHGVDEAHARLAALGLAPYPGHEDPYVTLHLLGSTALDTVRVALAGLPVIAFVYAPSVFDDVVTDVHGPLLGWVATHDAVDAMVAVGTAGPRHGIGTAALVRFLVTLRSFGRWAPDELGEDRLRLSIDAREGDAPERIAERALKICPPLARADVGVAAIAEDIRERHTLALAYA